MSLTPRNWSEFQQYKDRSPDWIKLHRNLLDNYDFARLPVESRALAPMLWLLASEYENGEITASTEEIAFRLRMTHDALCRALGFLIEAKFFVVSNDLSIHTENRTKLYESVQDCTKTYLEKEREIEIEIEIEGEKESLSEPSSDAPKRKRMDYPQDFEKFWTAYPTDALMSKKQAYDAWKRLAPEDRAKAHSAAPSFAEHCRKNPDYRPLHAVRFLSQRRFDGFAATSTEPPAEQIEFMRSKGYELVDGSWKKVAA